LESSSHPVILASLNVLLHHFLIFFIIAERPSLDTKPSMAANNSELPIVDLSGYLNPKSPKDKEQVIAQVRDACAQYGFFQIKGHGVPLKTQEGLIQSLSNLFGMSKEEKVKLSYLKNPCRRGYEGSGDSMQDGDALPDSKEVRVSWIHFVGIF
jgi:non-haem dioxygenase in morphine synthesis N-terminal